MLEGSVCWAAFWTSLTAAPSETPGGRLNDKVTEGSWPLWFTLKGPTSGDAEATDVSGTRLPRCERRCSSCRAAGSRWYRSEERRVGKECRSRWSPDGKLKKAGEL